MSRPIKVIDPSTFFVNENRPELLPSLSCRIDTLMSCFSMTRDRVMGLERKTHYGDRSCIGQVKKYLNKLTSSNFVVVSHGVFRLLQEDSSVSLSAIFDCILQYAFLYPNNAQLYARMCADLTHLYPKLPHQIDATIESVHNILQQRTSQQSNTLSYKAYIDDARQRRTACGCFVFVTYLYQVGVISRRLLISQWELLCDTIAHSIEAILLCINDEIEGHLSLLHAYVDCLRTSLRQSAIQNLLQTPAIGKTILPKLQHIFTITGFDIKRKKIHPRFPGKVWFGLVDLHDIYTRIYHKQDKFPHTSPFRN